MLNWPLRRLLPDPMLFYPAVFCTLIAIYIVAYLSDPNLPGNEQSLPLGWWGWWDQSKYLDSALAFAQASADPHRHWYFPGYSLLAAPFKFMRAHQFLIPDLLLVLAGSFAFLEVAKRLGLPNWAALVALALGLCPSWIVFRQYIIPWNTTLTMAIMSSSALLYVKAIDAGTTIFRSCALSGLVVAMALTRPIDILAMAPFFAHLLIKELAYSYRFRTGAIPILRMLGAALATLGICGAAGCLLYATLYGMKASPYLTNQADFSLVPEMIPFRFYAMFISPSDFFGGGIGIIPYMPWVGLGLLAAIYFSVTTPRYIALSISTLGLICIYLSYPDWVPHNVWRNFLIHYIIWPLLFFSMFAAVMISDLCRNFSYSKLSIILVPMLLFVCLKLEAVEITGSSQVHSLSSIKAQWSSDETIRGVHIVGGKAPWTAVVDRDQYVIVGDKRLTNMRDYRLIPTGDLIAIVFDRPVTTRSMEVSFPKDSQVATTAQLVPIKTEISLREPADWRRKVSDRFWP